MFGFLINSLTDIVAVAFPVVASYKALSANDITLMRPWLMYWVVVGTGHAIESRVGFITRYMPFYGLARLAVAVWLVNPASRGAVQLYTQRLGPWLRHHEAQIDALIARCYASITTLVRNLLSPIFGKKPSSPDSSAQAARLAPSTFTDALLSQFGLYGSPSSSTSGATSSSAAGSAATTGQATAGWSSMLAGWAAPKNSEEITRRRTELMAMVTNLDKLRNEVDQDGYDVVGGSNTESPIPARGRWFW